MFGEASVYMMTDEEESVRSRLAQALEVEFSHLPIEREVLPDVDWIAKSLEGLAPCAQAASSSTARTIATR